MGSVKNVGHVGVLFRMEYINILDRGKTFEREPKVIVPFHNEFY